MFYFVTLIINLMYVSEILFKKKGIFLRLIGHCICLRLLLLNNNYSLISFFCFWFFSIFVMCFHATHPTNFNEITFKLLFVALSHLFMGFYFNQTLLLISGIFIACFLISFIIYDITNSKKACVIVLAIFALIIINLGIMYEQWNFNNVNNLNQTQKYTEFHVIFYFFQFIANV